MSNEYQESWAMETLMANEARRESQVAHDKQLRDEFDGNRFNELGDALEKVGHAGRRIEETRLYSWQDTKKMEAIVKLRLAQQLISEVRNMFG